MKDEVQKHLKEHTQILFDKYNGQNWKAGSPIRKTIIYKHLKLLVRWYAQVDLDGKDSYDDKKTPLTLMEVFGMSASLFELFKKIFDYRNNPQDISFLTFLENEYNASKSDKLFTDIKCTLNQTRQLQIDSINLILKPLIFYEHMTPTDVIVRELIETKDVRKMDADDFYVLIIKKSQQLMLDDKNSKLRSKGRAQDRLNYIRDYKVNSDQMAEFVKMIQELKSYAL